MSVTAFVSYIKNKTVLMGVGAMIMTLERYKAVDFR